MEESGKQPMTESTRNGLDQAALKSLDTFARSAQKLRNYINKTEEAIDFLKKSSIEVSSDDDISRLLRLQEYILLLHLVWMDLTASISLSNKTKSKYENIYCSKQLLITVHEASKQLYHFGGHRKKSFWGKDIHNFVLIKAPYLTSKYKEITLLIEQLDKDLESFQWKMKRDMLVHYDGNVNRTSSPSKVYDLLEEIDIQSIAQRSIKFIFGVTQIINFTDLLLKEFEKTTTIYH
jgi:hypothetical protein